MAAAPPAIVKTKDKIKGNGFYDFETMEFFSILAKNSWTR